MNIDELNQQECRDFLSRASVARLACSRDGQPYVVPIGIAYDADYIYCFSTEGMKIDWMRANPKICLQADEIKGPSDWVSVVVNGLYQELPSPQHEQERAQAKRLLERRHQWWLTALSERRIKLRDQEIVPVFFRVQIQSLSGLRAMDEDKKASGSKH